MRKLILIVIICLAAVNAFAQEDGVTRASPALIKLPKAQMHGGKPLMQALKDRQSIREFSKKKFPINILSDLLWAAFGINRPDSGKRTAPSSYNMQEIDVYMVLHDGIYLYEPNSHGIKPVINGNFSSLTGVQDFVSVAPVNLVYVVDYSRMDQMETDEDKKLYSGIDSGFISQNVHLYCASEGLGTVTRSSIQREKLRVVMKLRPDQKIIIAQTVGYKKKGKK